MDVRLPEKRPATSLRSWLPATAQGRLRGIVAGALLATGMTALAAPPPGIPAKRAAWLLPPQKLEPGDVPAIARGAINDLPSDTIGSTPVVRSGKKPAGSESPAWLTGVDPSVIPASGLFSARSKNEVKALGSDSTPSASPARLSGSSGSTPTPYSFPKQLDKSKTPATADRPAGPAASGAEAPEPGAPLRGIAANGASLMAGPPAYRWYGYGSVTPGANTYAPAGQYPKASSNWYSVTGATPGAFPVPVVNPYRSAPGNEPPDYTVNPPSRHSTPGMAMGREPASGMVSPAPRYPMNASSSSGVPPMPSIGSIGTGSTPSQLSLPPLPQPVGVPLMVPPPSVSAVPSVELPVAPPLTRSILEKPLPSGGIPVDAKSPIEGLPVVATKPAASTTPEPLPPALTEDMSWKPMSEEPRPVPPGTWIPATTPSGAPSVPPPDLFLEPGAKNVKPALQARGQMPDSTRADPAIALIQGVCRGRAEGLDARWTSSKKLTVCFEVRTQPEANRLVKDISARPELAPFAIDFCVVVK